MHQCAVRIVVAGMALALGLGAGRLAAQEQASPAPEAQPPAVGEEAEPSEEEFKEEEPVTADAKVRKEEIEKKGCPTVDVKYKAETDKSQHPTPVPPPDKAIVYVVRPTMMGNKVQTKLAVDGEWVGVNRGHNYFVLTLDPGEHYLCSKAENKSAIALKVEAGKTYFVEQKVKMGFMKARNKLATLPEAEGQKKLAKCHPSTWEVKK